MRRTPQRHHLRALLGPAALIALLSPAGCYTFRVADTDPEPPTPLAADAWPEGVSDTSPSPAARLSEATPQRIHRYAPFPGETYEPGVAERFGQRATVITHNRLTPRGLLRVWREVPDNAPSNTTELSDTRHFASPVTPPNAAFLSHAALERHARQEAARAGARLAAGAPPFKETRTDTFLFFFNPPVRVSIVRPTTEQLLLNIGYDIGFPQTLPDDARGTIVYLPSTVPTRYEKRLLEDLRRRGWAILFVDSRPRVVQPNDTEFAATRELRSILSRRLLDRRVSDDPAAWRNALEIAGRARQSIPDPPTGFTLTQGPEDTGRQIAAAADDLLAEHAFAAEAALDLFFDKHPTLARRPVAIVGFSAGALAAPTVAARLKDRLHHNRLALLLVGGGGNIFRLAANSEFMSGGIRFDSPDDPELTPAARDAVARAYLDASSLDPLKSIAAVSDLPLLHVYADDDTWVPTAGALELNDAHGSADTLLHDGDHTTLFFFLGTQHRRIARWLEDNLPIAAR